MSEHRAPSSGSSSATHPLLLRVLRPNRQPEEYYIAGRMTVGRTDENTIIVNDETVDRTHARVDREADGTLWLRGFEASSLITRDDGAQVHELRLIEGARFQIGGVQFECLAGKRQPAPTPVQVPSACPFCHWDDLPDGHAGSFRCPNCQGILLHIPAPKSGDRDLVVPARYGQFRADRFVARGGMGLVLNGWDEANSCGVAIKLSQDVGESTSAASRFAQEISLLSRLSHPNVVRFLGFGHEAGFRYLVMEWVEGRSLREVIAEYKQSGCLPKFFDGIRCLEQTCEGLAAVHKLGIVHRDIKPSNIIIGDDRKVRLLDLGIAKRLTAMTAGLTTTGQAPGTWQYMAPEQVEAPDIVDCRADQYALGVTFYELLTGKQPLGLWQPASSLNATVPAEFDALLLRLLAQNREDRFPDVKNGLLPEVRKFRTALWSYRERHGVLVNYFEFTNHAFCPLTNVSVRGAIYRKDGSRRQFEIAIAQLPAGQTHRCPNLLNKQGECGLFGVLWSGFGWVEASMQHWESPLTLSASPPDGAALSDDPFVGTLVDVPLDPKTRQREIDARLALEQWRKEPPRIDAIIGPVKAAGARSLRILKVVATLSFLSFCLFILAYVMSRSREGPRELPGGRGPVPRFWPSRMLGQAKEITNSIGMKMVLIPAGEFMMGNSHTAEEETEAFKPYGIELEPEHFKDEYPCHRVRITKPFYLGQYEVTVGEFRKFVEDTGYKTDAEKGDSKGAFGFDPAKGAFEFKAKYSWRKVGFEQTDEHPVVCVSWNDAVAFCGWLSRKEGKGYRLPTEAEWEYACRAGTTTRYHSGDDPETLAQVGNVADATAKAKFADWTGAIADSDGYVFTAPVGRFRPNAFGLYDMHGNAWEWCADRYGEKYYAASPSDDPTGPDSGTGRVLRGGSWVVRPNFARSAVRNWSWPDDRINNFGFRLARTL